MAIVAIKQRDTKIRSRNSISQFETNDLYAHRGRGFCNLFFWPIYQLIPEYYGTATVAPPISFPFAFRWFSRQSENPYLLKLNEQLFYFIQYLPEIISWWDWFPWHDCVFFSSLLCPLEYVFQYFHNNMSIRQSLNSTSLVSRGIASTMLASRYFDMTHILLFKSNRHSMCH